MPPKNNKDEKRLPPQEINEKWIREIIEKNADKPHLTGQEMILREIFGITEEDAKEEAEMDRKKAEQGNAKAQYAMGLHYANGDGVKQDYVEAAKWHRKAAEQGHKDAQVRLGKLYAIGEGVEKDYIATKKWYKRAAEQGHKHAQLFLGLMYHEGQAGEQDYAKAAKWYYKAAKKGVKPAQHNFAMLLEFGNGVKRNFAEAVKWYKEAAGHSFFGDHKIFGEKNSQFKLGLLCEAGKGVKQDSIEATKWYYNAARNGHVDAQQKFNIMCKRALSLGESVIVQGKTISLPAILGMEAQEQKQVMHEWFLLNYENPAECCPYDPEDGCYIFISGGPYHANEVLGEVFSDYVNADVIDELVQDLENSSIEWSGILVDDEYEDEEYELNEQQEKAATYNGDATNILVTAGAGCGKTSVIIARATHLIQSGADASRILIMTFTNRAAREIKTRIKSDIGSAANKIQASTFHSFCLNVISKIPKSFDVSGLNIIDSDDQHSLMTIARNKLLKNYDKELKKEFPRPSTLIKYYSYSRNTCQEPQQYLSKNTDMNEEFQKICFKIFNEYRNAKELRGYLDYDDLLELFSDTLSRKPELRKAVTTLFDEVLIDEMQDTNPIQFNILQHFSCEGVRLFCVGDPAQSIYKFRGANFQNVYKFQEMFNNSKIFKLSLNYRSYQEILDFSNWLLERSPLDYKNKLVAHRGECGYLPSLSEFDSSLGEASWIADKIIERSHSDINFKDVMVLVRSGSDARPIEAEFMRRKIPYFFVGGTSLTKAAHVRDVLSLLRVVRNDKDDLAWMRFLKLWPRIGEKTADKLIGSFDKKTDVSPIQLLSESLGSSHGAISAYEQTSSTQLSPKACIAAAVQSLSPRLEEKYDKWSFREQDLKLLITVSKKYKTISDFIDAFTLEPMTSTELRQPGDSDAVLLITVHSAKGTESPICFVANAKQGTYPHIYSCGDLDDEEEERRVLYVALTRAKNELFVTRSTNYNSGFYVQNKPTIGEEYFLSEIPESLVSQETYGWEPNNSKGLSSLRDVY